MRPPLRPSERRYARMLAKVTPWPAEVVEMVVASCGSGSRRFLDEAARHNRHPLEALGAQQSNELGAAIDDFKAILIREAVEPWALPVTRWLTRVLQRLGLA